MAAENLLNFQTLPGVYKPSNFQLARSAQKALGVISSSN